MNKPIYDFFTNDHRRLEYLLEKATENMDAIDMESYLAFRIGLLTHISLEEKVLFKAAQIANNNEPIPLAKQLRVEHGAITSLMVPPPNAELIKVIKTVLEKHDILEEEEGGMYDMCEELTHGLTEKILQELRNFPPVRVHPNNDIPLAWEAAKRACARAGWDYDEIANS